ncbi:hypothetical protein DSO57_1032068 [Entomophthora muscae]|nr:hypothetical protein DSO57_1032068 [Entomophthora muscae]
MSRQDRLLSEEGAQKRRRRVIKADINSIRGLFENALKRKSPKPASPVRAFRGRPSLFPPSPKTPRTAPRVGFSTPKSSAGSLSIQPKESPNALLMALCSDLPASPSEQEDDIDILREAPGNHTPFISETTRFSGLESLQEKRESSKRLSLHALTPQPLTASHDDSSTFDISLPNIFTQSGVGISEEIRNAFQERLSITPLNRSYISDITNSFSNTENLSFVLSPSARAVGTEDPILNSPREQRESPHFEVSADFLKMSPNQDSLNLDASPTALLDVSTNTITPGHKDIGSSPAQPGEMPPNDEWADLSANKSRHEDSLQDDPIAFKANHSANLRRDETAYLQSSDVHAATTADLQYNQTIDTINDLSDNQYDVMADKPNLTPDPQVDDILDSIDNPQYVESIAKLSDTANPLADLTIDKPKDVAEPHHDEMTDKSNSIVDPHFSETIDKLDDFADENINDLADYGDFAGKADAISLQHEDTASLRFEDVPDKDNNPLDIFTDFEFKASPPKKEVSTAEIAEREAFGDFDPLSLGLEDMPAKVPAAKFPGRKGPKMEERFSILALNLGRLGLGLKTKAKPTRSSGRNLK